MESRRHPTQYLPWTTEPTAAGFTICNWCDRAIYLPALPCSTRPVDGLRRMMTTPGLGARCQWELSIRRPEVIDRSSEEFVEAQVEP